MHDRGFAIAPERGEHVPEHTRDAGEIGAVNPEEVTRTVCD